MPDVVISDTSCLIILSNIQELDLLKRVYKNVITTPEIANEFGELLPSWVKIKSPVDVKQQHIFELQVDKGEASAIALALETPGSLLILDDLQARTFAEKLGIVITGTLGVIIKAKLNGIIPSVKHLLAKIKQTNFRISSALEEIVLKEAGE